MDLGAYIQIEDLGVIADINGIDVPRLRGYRLMKDEKPVNYKNDIKTEINYIYEDFCRRVPFGVINYRGSRYSDSTDRLCTKYLIKKGDKVVGFRWDKLHGKARKTLKYIIKRHKKATNAQYVMWNKYAGQDNVLYIHSRTGGWTRSDFAECGWADYTKEPWFLDRVDDWRDRTYCDIYAKIDRWPTEEGIAAYKAAHNDDEED